MTQYRTCCKRLFLCTSISFVVGTTSAVWGGGSYDGTMGPTGTFSGDFEIPHTNGTPSGTNLFHSFSSFSINAGESATFTGPDNTFTNVISRVTGSDPSTFNGPLTSLIDPSTGLPTTSGANFFFMNPNGLIFKEGAQINVNGSFYATTSNSINFDGGFVFYADSNLDQPSLATSSPSSFGFLDSNPGQIALEGAQLVNGSPTLSIPGGATFSLIGGNITLGQATTPGDVQIGTQNGTGSFISAAMGNRVEIVSVASQGDAIMTNGGYDLSSFATLGNIDMNGGSVIDGTEIYIRGGNIVMEDSVVASGFFAAVGLAPPPNGGSIDVEVSDQINVTGNSPLFIEVYAFPPGAPGPVPVPVAKPDGGPYYSGFTAYAGDPVGSQLAPPPLNAADVPDINITADNITMTGFSGIITERFGLGNASDITINANTVEMRNGSLIANVNYYEGAGGTITVNADQVILDGEGDPSGFTGITGASFILPLFANEAFQQQVPPFDIYNPALTYADAASITINATGSGLTIRGGASINAESQSFGKGGDVTINASDIVLLRDGMPFGAIASQSLFVGDSGNIQINATGNIQLQEGFEISASSAGIGNAGVVSISAGNAITISGENSGIASATVEPPPSVEQMLAEKFFKPDFETLVADLNLAPGSDMFAVLGALEAEGKIDLRGSAATAGDAGGVSVSANSLSMNGLGRITSSTTADGDGGPIDINVETLSLSDGAEIRSRSGLVSDITGELDVGTGNGGDIDIAANDISMQSGSSISVSSLGDGLAGNISASTNTLNISDSSITSQAEGNGDGGDISVTAASSITMQNNSSISSSALGNGLAGNISMDAGQQLDMVNSSISTQATVSDGGNIDIQAVKMIYLDQSEITTSVESGVGGGGNINIDPDFVVLKQSNILANAFGGPGGNINIVAGNFIATPDSLVDASSALGIDGTVNISSPDEEISEDLAVLPDNFLDVTSLISERCGTTAGASSLVDAGPGGLVVDPDGYLPSFATATDLDNEQEKGESNSVSSNRWWAPYSHQSSLQIAELTCLR